MPGCCAPNCKNSFQKGFRLFGFPTDPARRKRWIINCRRYKWKPAASSRLCEVHFEESQYEQNRQDGRKLLKKSAVPTIFDVPNPPKRLQSLRPPPKIRVPPPPKEKLPTKSRNQSELNLTPTTSDTGTSQELTSLESLRKENSRLKQEVLEYEKREQQMNDNLYKCLHEDQLMYLKRFGAGNSVSWKEDTIKEALKIWLLSGQKAYTFLRQKGFPLPSCKTLNRHIESGDTAEISTMDMQRLRRSTEIIPDHS